MKKNMMDGIFHIVVKSIMINYQSLKTWNCMLESMSNSKGGVW